MAETFRKWAGSSASGGLVHELKVSRESLISRFRTQVDGKLLERFLLFFGFPGSFGLRQFCGLLEGAANCNLRFIYFWVFSLLDENANGILTGQDFFEFLQRFATSNFYVEAEIYQIQNELSKIEESFRPGGEEGETYVEEMLAMNHSLRLEEVKSLLKQNNKQRISVGCVKNTCYHQTVLSLDHDPLERIKQDQLEHNQLASQKQQMLHSDAKRTLLTTPGIRLRHFYSLFAGKRPKIFCYFLHLLTSLPPQDY